MKWIFTGKKTGVSEFDKAIDSTNNRLSGALKTSRKGKYFINFAKKEMMLTGFFDCQKVAH